MSAQQNAIPKCNWENSAEYSRISKKIDELTEAWLNINSHQKEIRSIRPFITAQAFPNLISAAHAATTEYDGYLYDCAVIGLVDFCKTGDELVNDVREQLLLATAETILEVNHIIECVEVMTNADFSDLKMSDSALDNWFLDSLVEDLNNLNAQILRQAQYYPELNICINRLKAKVDEHDSKNFVRKGAEYVGAILKGAVQGYVSPVEAIANSVLAFFEDNSDPDYKRYLQLSNELCAIADKGYEAAYSFENNFASLHTSLITDGDFKKWTLDICEQMLNRGISEDIICKAIEQRKDLQTLLDDGDDEEDDENNEVRMLDLYDNMLCAIIDSEDHVWQANMWTFANTMKEFLIMSNCVCYFDKNIDYGINDIKAKYKELENVKEIFTNPIKDYLESFIQERLRPIVNRDNEDNFYVKPLDDEESVFKKKKLIAARDQYADLLMIDDIIACYDDTLFGKGDNGFIISALNLYIKEFGEDPIRYNWEDINEIFYSEKSSWGSTSYCLQINGKDYPVNLSESDMETLVIALREVVEKVKAL